jgi:MarR family transcriptional regulator for hemolysin
MLQNHNLFHSIHQLSRHLTKCVNEALQPFGLYSAQWSVLYTLKLKGTLTQTELCEYLSVEAPPMTRTIQRLVKQGYVKQVPGEDRRIKQISLTEKALEAYPKWENAVLAVNATLLKQFSPASQEELYTLTSEWLRQLQKLGGE